MPTIKDLLSATHVSSELDTESANHLTITDQAIDLAFKLVQSQANARLGFTLPPRFGLEGALEGAVQSVSALLCAGAVKCDLLLPEKDIEMIMNTAGQLIYRCKHSPSHEWDLNGNLLP